MKLYFIKYLNGKSRVAIRCKLQAARSRNGFIALISVLIVLTITLAIALSVTLLGIGEAQMGLAEDKSAESFYLADACAEEAFMRLKRNSDYAGGSLSVGVNSCIIGITADGNNRTVDVSSSVNDLTRRIRAEVTLVITPKITKLVLNSWEEVTD